MNISHPLKFHFYTYRKPFLVYFIIYFLAVMLSYFAFNNLNNFYKYLSVGIFLLTILFTILNSVYEFTLLIFHYLNLKTIQREFYISSIIHSIINSLIQTFFIFISYQLLKVLNPEINSVFMFSTNIFIYLFTFLLHLCVFSVIGIISLLFKNIKYVQLFLYSILIIIVALMSLEITKSIIDFINITYSKIDVLIKLSPLLFLFTVLIWGIIYLKTNKINQK